jgi:hypothetical protein
MHSGDKFPPETLLHAADFVHELIDDLFFREDIRTARVVRWHMIEKLINSVERTGHQLA